MDPDTESPGVGRGVRKGLGRHLLGPQVVGRRVVVRRVLRGQIGPSGGPAMTDVLGVCTAWGDGLCVVDGQTIVIADIVSGKPVPPRPSARHRAGPGEAQRRALALWPDLVTSRLEDWILRTSQTSTARRANSVLAIGDPGLEDPVSAVAAYYHSRGRRPIAAVVADSPEYLLFRDRAWVPESTDADTLFQIAAASQAHRALRRLSASRPALPALVEEDGHLAVASIGDAASGVAAYADGWVGFRSLEVRPDQRRQGLGLAVMAALLEWGAERGATTAYLQVLGQNAAAISLYERLGFATHHAYRYLAEPR